MTHRLLKCCAAVSFLLTVSAHLVFAQPSQQNSLPNPQLKVEPVAQPPQPRRAPIAEHNKAVALARSGNNKEGLALLESLAKTYPNDIGVKRDYCVVLNWDGRYAQSVAVFVALPVEEPDYVILAAAGSYRRLQKFRQALDLYRSGSQRFPGNMDFKSGELLTMTDAREPKEALAEADRVLSAHRDSIPLLLAAGYAAMALGRPTDALPYYDQVLMIDPKNREATQQQKLASEAIRSSNRATSHHRKKSTK